MAKLSIEKLEKVAVLGAGTMGQGIAHVAALAGWKVALYDIREDMVLSALDRIGTNLDEGVRRGKIVEPASTAAKARLAGSAELTECVQGALLVVEAVPEQLELKQKIFAQVEGLVDADCLLATNTSSLSVGAIASKTHAPERVLGLHFFNPVHIMKLLEIVRHDQSAESAVTMAKGIALKLGKTAIVVRDVPGFASSRLGIALGLEAMRMFEARVASAEDIDTAMQLGYGHPMGPLELTDLVGLDVRLSIAEGLAKELGAHFEPPQILRDLVAQGRLGKKSGQGFYRWQDGKRVG